MAISRTAFSTGDIPAASEWNNQFDDVYNLVNTLSDGTGVVALASAIVDNVTINGNDISTSNTDGNLTLTPNGTGKTVIKNAQNNSTTGITADTNQDQANATLLTTTINNVTVVGTSGDAVKLSPMSVGDYQEVINSDSSENLAIFPNTDQNLGEGNNTSCQIQPGVTEGFRCIAANVIQRVINNGVGDFIFVGTGAGHGSSNTRIRRIETAVSSFGTAITQTNSSTLGSIWTINIAGVYSMELTDRSSSATNGFGITVNSTQLSTNIGNLTNDDEILGYSQQAVVNENFQASATAYLKVGDIVRCQDEASSTGNTFNTSAFRITKTK